MGFQLRLVHNQVVVLLAFNICQYQLVGLANPLEPWEQQEVVIVLLVTDQDLYLQTVKLVVILVNIQM